MNESQIDLAHTVALGSIGDEDQRAVAELLNTDDPVLRAAFTQEVQQTREALAVAASAVGVLPPPALRDRLLAAIATDPAPSIHRSTTLRHGNGRTDHQPVRD
ncbi:RskA family anti-sigma factor [Nocardia sp. NBC_00511]|uniref:RskA family anti-sigma factor n=1 Tax=Nocardia sp. NBC_00511 TaxID=2903591 RepID=UPI0030E466AC